MKGKWKCKANPGGSIMTINKKKLTEKIIEILQEDDDSNYICADGESRVILDGCWNIERLATRLTEYIVKELPQRTP
jgi:hypothetical protein